MPKRIGFVYSATPKSLGSQLARFYEALSDNGYNADDLDIRFADHDPPGKGRQHANDLIRGNVQVLVAAGGPDCAFVAKNAANRQTWVVFTSATDPVGSGLSTNPITLGDKLTGVEGLTTEKDTDRLGLLPQLISGLNKVGLLVNPRRNNVANQTANLERAARNLGLTHETDGPAGNTAGDIRAAIQRLANLNIQALLVTADPLFNDEKVAIIKEVARLRIPTIYQWTEFVIRGGLISYGPSLEDEYYNAGVSVAQILTNGRPTNQNLYRPSKFELAINLVTAEDDLGGFRVPRSLLDKANLVIKKPT
jgi:putative tryptophan/tyrosine transport system substrate-binding protein